MKLLILCSDSGTESMIIPVFSGDEAMILLAGDGQDSTDISRFDAVIICGDYTVCLPYMPNMLSVDPPFILLSGTLSYSLLVQFINDGGTAHIPLPASRGFIRSGIRRIIADQHVRTRDIRTITDPVTGTSIRTDISDFLAQFRLYCRSAVHHNRLVARLHRRDAGKRACLTTDTNDALTSPYSLKELETALLSGEFQLFYQPVVDLQDDNQLAGFEALVRWIKPDGTIIGPDEFIPVMEQKDLILQLSDSILDQSLMTLGRWNRRFKSDVPLRVNVNLSARLFANDTIADTVIRKAHRYGIKPEQLGLELTESALMESMESANIILLKLKAEGFVLYMDDFGTGYSSLSYLQHFPVNILKIDKSFVKWLLIDEESEHIVRSIVGLAHGLGRKVVAEGIEEEEHATFLRSIGCEYGQGYYFSRPMPVSDAQEYIARSRSLI